MVFALFTALLSGCGLSEVWFRSMHSSTADALALAERDLSEFEKYYNTWRDGTEEWLSRNKTFQHTADYRQYADSIERQRADMYTKFSEMHEKVAELRRQRILSLPSLTNSCPIGLQPLPQPLPPPTSIAEAPKLQRRTRWEHDTTQSLLKPSQPQHEALPLPPPRPVLGIQDLLKRKGHHIIILRGLPGSGKSYAARAIKAAAKPAGRECRVLSIDDYHVDVDTGCYAFDEAADARYRLSLAKNLSKTLEKRLFDLVVVDAVNCFVADMKALCTIAHRHDFEPYISNIFKSLQHCIEESVDRRTPQQVRDLSKRWEMPKPLEDDYIYVDLKSLLNPEIEEVEMADDICSSPGAKDDGNEKKKKPLWRQEDDLSADQLRRIDGLTKKKVSRKRPSAPLYSYDEATDIVANSNGGCNHKKSRIGKRVVWADAVKLKGLQDRKELGFVVGQTSKDDWKAILSENMDGLAYDALVQVRFISNDS